MHYTLQSLLYYSQIVSYSNHWCTNYYGHNASHIPITAVRWSYCNTQSNHCGIMVILQHTVQSLLHYGHTATHSPITAVRWSYCNTQSNHCGTMVILQHTVQSLRYYGHTATHRPITAVLWSYCNTQSYHCWTMVILQHTVQSLLTMVILQHTVQSLLYCGHTATHSPITAVLWSYCNTPSNHCCTMVILQHTVQSLLYYGHTATHRVCSARCRPTQYQVIIHSQRQRRMGWCAWNITRPLYAQVKRYPTSRNK